jgi:hypothetical protein
MNPESSRLEHRVKWVRHAALAAAVLATAYAGSYLVLRHQWCERWERDGRIYMVYPKAATVLYYLYRPLSYADAALTGMRFHIGPHQ